MDHSTTTATAVNQQLLDACEYALRCLRESGLEPLVQDELEQAIAAAKR